MTDKSSNNKRNKKRNRETDVCKIENSQKRLTSEDNLFVKSLFCDTNDKDFCKNPQCNHLSFKENPQKLDIPIINKIETLNDLILLGNSFHCKRNLKFKELNLRIICNIVPALKELNMMVGIKDIKNQIINQILYFIQGYNENQICNTCIDCLNKLPCPYNKNEMLHTIVTGPPGVGKTQFSKILGKIYKGLGVLKNGNFHEVKRSDLIGKWLGHTAVLTQNAINEASGGILFIDEAYSLGAMQHEDIFSKECIDTLTYNLSDKRDFLCIIAGYEHALDKCLFNVNNGLRRRFSFKYNFEKYKTDELLEIFENKVYIDNWKLLYKEKNDISMKTEIIELFKTNENNMHNHGGDMETLFFQCRIIHCRTIPTNNNKYILTNDDLIKGFEFFKINRGYKENSDNSWKTMYI